MADVQQVVDRILAGDVRAAARLMRDLDDGVPGAREVLKGLYPNSGRAHLIGVTGSPGVGKSTLTDRLIQRLRADGRTVGVVAVDPTSPFSGGAILGDRIRMQRHATDPGVFIRSLATRGHFGGLTASTRAVLTVLDAMGKDVLLAETVGVGQDEVEIAATADTTIVVTVPGLGDDIQALKAGLLEVADLLVVNKADREGADRTRQDLLMMLDMRRGRDPESWQPRVYLTQAKDDVGVAELLEGVREHREFLHRDQGRALAAARRGHVRQEFLELLKEGVFRRLVRRLDQDGRLEAAVEAILARRTDPYSACEEMIRTCLDRSE
ncbi:MAG: methylmalonyl Co-A mutase-associated GTPase MeaB [Deltaproteobacteria bacterium]|nr:methylmalonyl Co-A mutase-associated GTPase MeaB [Deltaproteobacteria bacterium]